MPWHYGGWNCDVGVPKLELLPCLCEPARAKQSPTLREIASAKDHRLATTSSSIISDLGTHCDVLSPQRADKFFVPIRFKQIHAMPAAQRLRGVAFLKTGRDNKRLPIRK